MMRQKTFFVAVMCCLSLILMVLDARANIIIKVRALNPLESEETAAIFYPLPKEVTPNDIVDKKMTFSLGERQAVLTEEGEEPKTTFNVEYVQEEGRYYISDEVALGPREVVTMEVHVRDIWTIPQDVLDAKKKEVEDLMARYSIKREASAEEGQDEEGQDQKEEASEKDFSDETITALKSEIFAQLDEMAARQEKASVLNVGVEKHMDAYYKNLEALAQLEADVGMLRYMLEPEEEEEEEGIRTGSELQEELPGEEELLQEDSPVFNAVDLPLENI